MTSFLSTLVRSSLALAAVAFFLLGLPLVALATPLGFVLIVPLSWIYETLLFFLLAIRLGSAPTYIARPFFEYPSLFTSLQWGLMATVTALLVHKRFVKNPWIAALLVCGATALLVYALIRLTGIQVSHFKM
jgi:hypothetical protein